MAAAIISYVLTSESFGEENRKRKYVVSWTSATGGAATLSIPDMNGWLIKIVTDPGATAPTDDYDITLIDENSVDALQSLGLNRDTANTESTYTFVSGAPVPIYLSGTHTFTLANAGDEKVGTCTFYMIDSL
jgi:hypothetical protein